MKIEELLRRKLRLVGHKYNTEKAYVQKYHQFIQFTKTQFGAYKHPAEMGHKEIEDFLTHLAADRLVSADTQRVAMSALRFLYEKVLEIDLGVLNFSSASKSAKLPVVMSFREIELMLSEFTGVYKLQSEIMYGCGLRIGDCLRLRVKDLDFENNTIQINNSKGDKHRLLMMPKSIKPALKKQLSSIRAFYENDRAENAPGVWMPSAIDQKAPAWGKSWDWFWLFPAYDLAKDPRANMIRRHHVTRHPYSTRFKAAKLKLEIAKQVVPHTSYPLLKRCKYWVAPRALTVQFSSHDSGGSI